ncbi:hypothetical protein [Flexithrix dorotheae]|uniref:hypothetical protein n=1 Tax=Flexithrix dorotheae TaxID=70993 RepID=UPI000366A5CB|nr:hypothetical protein [Flexithrix dorotheae]
MKEYKIAKGWAIFIYLFAPLLIGLFGWVLILPFQNGDFLPNFTWILIPISVAMIAVMVFGVMEAYKGKFIISSESIKSIGSFSNKVLKFDEIKGFTVNEQYIFIEPKNRLKKRIKVSTYTGGFNEILKWLYENYPDLDQQNAIKEEQEILSDDSVGWTKEIREEKLKRARKTTKIINWAAGLVAAWIFFYPTPYQYSIFIAAVIPIIALIVTKTSNGLIRIDEKKGSAYPSVIHAFIYPSLGIMLRALLDYEIFDYENLWFTVLAITILFLVTLIIKQREITFKKKMDFFTVGSLSLFLFAYSYGIVIHYNCFYDYSEPTFYTAKVLDKRISSGKSTTRYLELTTWGPQTEIDEVSVGKEFYNQTEIGDQVNIYFRKGNLEIPWFIVTDN